MTHDTNLKLNRVSLFGRHHWAGGVLLLIVGWCFALNPSLTPRLWADDELKVDDIMWRDPFCESPPLIRQFDPKLLPLWSQAIRRSEPELRRLASDTVAIAKKRGMADAGKLTEQLVEVLNSKDQQHSVRRAAAHALVVLDAKGQAELLAKVAASDGLEAAQIIEPALAKWNFSPMRETWLKRLQDHNSLPMWRLLAMQCLGLLKEPSAKDALLAHVQDKQLAPQLRMAAAQSAGEIVTDGLLPDARKLLVDKQPAGSLDRILGVKLIAHHGGQETIGVLHELAGDTEPVVATVAWARLLEIDPKLTFDIAPVAIGNADVNVRRAGARSLIAKGDIEAITLLGPMIDDPNPSLRRFVSKSLYDLAEKAELRAAVIAESEKMLKTDKWRGLEQATLISVYLDHKSVANRQVELLAHYRREVAVTAAWALRRFRVPETLPPMLRHAEMQFERMAKGQAKAHEYDSIGGQHTQLFQAFGEMRFKEADPLMRKFVPKTTKYKIESRAAACWALGYLHENSAPEDLTNLFVERLSDVQAPMPEFTPVRLMCAAGLGRMKSMTTIPVLHKFAQFDGITAIVGQACWWSIEQLTDEKRPEMPKQYINIPGWFLTPTN